MQAAHLPVIDAFTIAQLEQYSTSKGVRHNSNDNSEKEGKRWIRRRDNSRFLGNGHIVKPSTQDFNLNLSLPRSTFPEPLPPFLPRRVSAPSASPAPRDVASANAGRYSLSLKGIRRGLRRSGPRAEQVVLDMEQELTKWLRSGGVLLSPDSQHPLLPSAVPGTPIGFSNTILELRRSPTELIWRVDDNFPRYLLHCVARYHGVVSFSKTAPGADPDMRLTHLLRPNVTRPDFAAPGALDTPPASDVDAFSVIVDTEDSDAASELTSVSDENMPNSPRGQSDNLPEGSRDLLVPPLEDHGCTSSDDPRLLMDNDALRVEAPSLSQDWEQTSGRSRPSSRPAVRRFPRRVPNSKAWTEDRLAFWQYVFA